MTTGGTIAGFALFFGGSIALACIFDWIIRRSPLREAEPSRLDRMDGIDAPRCWSSGPRGGHAYRVERGTWTCMRCGDRRAAS